MLTARRRACRLVDGYNLTEFRRILTARGSIDVPQHELHVKEVAAQLLQASEQIPVNL